jgi:CHAT domain-containing protein
VKRLGVIVLSLCVLTCRERDTNDGKVRPRTVEPRLSIGQAWRECCAPSPPARWDCVRTADTRVEAVRLLAEEPDCTDEAVETLQRVAAADARALSDLAAAYYIRARQHDRPSDLLRAYDAVHAASDSPEVRFNQALIEEALGVHASWDEYLKLDSRSPWAAEAKRRRRTRPGDAVAQWNAAIAAAVQSDARTASRLIAPFPGVAQVHFEDRLLAPEADPDALETFAEALFLRTHDPLARDIVRAMRSDPRGIGEFHAARGGQRAMKEAEDPLLRASRLLLAAGNPLHLVAEYRYASAQAVDRGGEARALAILDRIEPEVQRRGYRHLLARIHSLRGYCLGYQSNFVDSLTAYGKALQQYEALQAFDGIAGTKARIAGVLRKAGDPEAAAREVLGALRDAHRVVDTREQQNVIGELSATALELGLPHAAWHYADSIVAGYHARLIATDPADTGELTRLKKELGLALNNRANVAVERRDYDAANADLDEAVRLSADPARADPRIRRLTDIALYEIRGRASALRPREAIAAYTQALQLAERDAFHTLRASLYAQRAGAYMQAGQQTGAAEDLQRAVLALEAEEELIFRNRERPSSEVLPPGYFARFQDTYLQLIRHELDRRDVVQAFLYAEYARGPETKKLLAQLRLSPSLHGSLAHFESIRARLPRGGTLLQYSVMEDRTYVWVISAERTSVHRLGVTRQDVERWTRDLYRAERRRRPDEFDVGLYAPYARLFEPVLRHVDRAHGTPRLIIVPDGAMYGLPFPALRNPDNDRYLIQDYILETAPSATLYAFARTRDAMLAKSGAPSLFIMGNPRFDPTLPLIGDLPSLPHAEQEARLIAAIYGAEPVIGAAATVPAFLQGAAPADIVQFAGHAVVNSVTPSASYLLMARSDGHSGVLTAGELLDGLTLDRTRLVVLSACSSAGGRGVGAAGVAPLVRPILTAGVPAVIGSLWNVNDATTRELLVSFHQHFRQRKDAAVALRGAQLALLGNRNRSLQAGLAWAPFQVIGHASSPFAPAQHEDKGEPP